MITKKQIKKIIDFFKNLTPHPKNIVFLEEIYSGPSNDICKTRRFDQFIGDIEEICEMPLDTMAGEIDFSAKIGKDWYQIATRCKDGSTHVKIRIDKENADWYNSLVKDAQLI